jgi:RNA polymerase sigma-70 factor (TIGR02960 family)
MSAADAPTWSAGTPAFAAARKRSVFESGGVCVNGVPGQFDDAWEDDPVSNQLLNRARDGDEVAFAQLIGPHRRELHVHCYRTLGSLQDAEDALQETLLAAWRSLAGFQHRASLRTWLYTIATNRCLNMLRAAERRPKREPSPPHSTSEPATAAEATWVEPYPDLLLGELTLETAGPDTRYETKEAISLAFVTALQLLPSRQRSALVLRDVLGFHAAEVAAMLDTTEASVTSALKRARAALDGRLPTTTPPEPRSQVEVELVEQLTAAFETKEIDGLVGLLADDVRLSMPPLPFDYRGREQAARFLTDIAAVYPDRRLTPTRANGQPALALYARDTSANPYRALGLLVLTLAGEHISAITRFEVGVLAYFDLPRTLPAGKANARH